MCRILPAFLVLLFLFPVFNCIAQGNKVDSLRKVLKLNNTGRLALDDTSKARTYQQLAYAIRHNETDSAIYFSRRALELVKDKEVPRLKGTIYKNLTRLHYLKGEYDISLLNVRKAYVIFQSLNDFKNLANCLTSEGLVYAAWGEHKKALDLYQESLSYSQSSNFRSQTAATFYDMGISKKALEQYDQAISYFRRSIDIKKAVNDSTFLARNFFFLAEIYTEQMKLDKAKVLFLKSIEYLSPDNNWDLAFANAGLARMYNQMGKPELALKYGKKSYQYALEIDAKWELQRVTEFLAKSYASLANYKKAYEYQLKHNKYHELVYNKTREQNLARIQLAREESKNEILQTQNQRQSSSLNNTRFIIVILIMLVTFVGILAFLLFRNSKRIKDLNDQLKLKNSFIREARRGLERQNRELKELNETKNKILSIISHDARSPISSLQSLLSYVEDEDLPTDEFKMLLVSIKNNLRQTSQMFDNMLKWAKSQFKSFQPTPEIIEIRPLIEELILECEEAFKQKKININNYTGKRTYAYADYEMIRVVFRNILSNAIKFCDENDSITFKDQIIDGMIRIYTIDTGIGISDEQINLVKSNKKFTREGTKNESGSGFGLTICQDFIDINDGRFIMEGEPGEGTTIIVELPVAEKQKRSNIKKLSGDTHAG